MSNIKTILKCECRQCNRRRNYKLHNGNFGGEKLTLNEFIIRARKIHGDLYDYSDSTYIGSKKSIQIKCIKHDSYFWKTPENHIFNSQGCPICQLSKGELAISTYLSINKIAHKSQQTFDTLRSDMNRPLKYDFYIPYHNLLIEFDGQQHFGCNNIKGHIISDDKLARLKLHDKLKDEYAIKNNIKLLRISYKDLNNIPAILKQHIT